MCMCLGCGWVYVHVFGLWVCTCVCVCCMGVGGCGCGWVCMCVCMSETLSSKEKYHNMIIYWFADLELLHQEGADEVADGGASLFKR